MEKINLNNYPVWITEYHDGTLQGVRVEELFAFLSEHPELMEEFEQYDHTPLHPDLSDRPLRKGLKRDFSELTLIQQEEFTAALVEGDITGEEAEEMMSHIAASPYLMELYHSLKVIRLRPENISFPGKRSLKRYPLLPQFNRAVVTLLTAAASIAILFSISILLDRNKPLSAPFTGSAEIDPVIIIEKEHNNGNTTAENIPAVTEDTKLSENPENFISDTIAGRESGNIGEGSINNPATNASAENSSREIRNREGENRITATAENRTNSTETSADPTSDILVVGQVINAGITEQNLSPENVITGEDNTGEKTDNGDHRIVTDQQRGSFDLPYIKQPATPNIKEVNDKSIRLAEMTPLEVEEETYPGSPREFIAKSFRQLILNDKNATTERVKPIELADATVTGINKLLGWEMKLEKKSDDSGTLNSISFASQLIKFDHNIKNSGN